MLSLRRHMPERRNLEATGKTGGVFYVPEHLAKPLEQDIQNSNNVAEMVFSYRPGRPPPGFEPAGQRQNVEWARELFFKTNLQVLITVF